MTKEKHDVAALTAAATDLLRIKGKFSNREDSSDEEDGKGGKKHVKKRILCVGSSVFCLEWISIKLYLILINTTRS